MNYEKTLSYLFEQLPMYQRMGQAAYKADLSNTLKLTELLGNPENKFKSVHIAGTNGKGSTSHMLASILQESGYKVGLYTSPHLKDFRERIRINGKMIEKSYVIEFVDRHKEQFEQINLSFFEWTVGLAFTYFADRQVDIAVIETGLGGRLDSTNVITPELCIITNIGIDHTQFLGNTLEKIATEKAGIIKNKVPIIIGEEQADVKHIFINQANKVKAPVFFANKEIKDVYNSDLKGKYQEKNIKAVILAVEILSKNGWNIPVDNVKTGLLNVVKNTGLMGRWQILNERPLIICDTGHNEDGIKQIVAQLKEIRYHKLHFVYGAVNDKSIDPILDILPKNARYYFCQANIPRALNVNELFNLAKTKALHGDRYNNVKEAFDAAKSNATNGDLVFIGGSTFVVAEVL